MTFPCQFCGMKQLKLLFQMLNDFQKRMSINEMNWLNGFVISQLQFGKMEKLVHAKNVELQLNRNLLIDHELKWLRRLPQSKSMPNRAYINANKSTKHLYLVNLSPHEIIARQLISQKSARSSAGVLFYVYGVQCLHFSVDRILKFGHTAAVGWLFVSAAVSFSFNWDL